MLKRPVTLGSFRKMKLNDIKYLQKDFDFLKVTQYVPKPWASTSFNNFYEKINYPIEINLFYCHIVRRAYQTFEHWQTKN